MTQNEITTNCICDILRDAATLIKEFDVRVRFVENDHAFVDDAYKIIKHGGQVEPTCLYSLIHYIADMMEQ